MNEQQREIRRLTGFVPADGDPIPPSYEHREDMVMQAIAAWPRTRIYPRRDIDKMDPYQTAMLAGALRDYSSDGSVYVEQSRGLDTRYGRKIVKINWLKIPREGELVDTMFAIVCLQRDPLLVTVEEPADEPAKKGKP